MIIRGEKYLPVGTFGTAFVIKKVIYFLKRWGKWLLRGCCRRYELLFWWCLFVCGYRLLVWNFNRKLGISNFWRKKSKFWSVWIISKTMGAGPPLMGVKFGVQVIIDHIHWYHYWFLLWILWKFCMILSTKVPTGRYFSFWKQ